MTRHSFGRRWIGLLLRLYPRRFRDHYAADMVASFMTHARDVRIDGGRRAVARLWIRTTVNLVVSAAAEHWRGSFDAETLRPRSLIHPHRRHARRWEEVVVDIRLAVRRLRARPGAAIASVVTLGCAIAAGAATWSLLSALLLHPLPVANPAGLVAIGSRQPNAPRGMLETHHLFTTYAAVSESGIFESLAAGGNAGFAPLVSVGGSPQRRVVFFASDDYFTALGVALQQGRSFAPDEDRPGAPLVAVASDRFWREQLDGTSAAIGRTVTVSGKPATIIGVLSRGFHGLTLAESPDLYMPLRTIADVLNGGMTNFFNEPSAAQSPTAWVGVTARLRPGMRADEAASRLQALSATTPAMRNARWELVPADMAALPEDTRASMTQFMRLLGVTVGLLVLIGCLTVGTLLLIRTEARRDEFALCLALGASRRRLARSILIEGALLSFTGAALAVPVSGWLLNGLRAFQLSGGIRVDSLDLTIDVRVLLAVGVCAVAGCVLIALVAGVFGFSANIADVLRARAGATPRLLRRRTRAALVVAQVAAALVLVAGATLFARSLIRALNLNPGFDTARLVTGNVYFAPDRETPERAAQLFADLGQRLSRNPAIQSVSMSTFAWAMSASGRLTIDGVPRRVPTAVYFNAVDARYFSTIRLPILRGRDFLATDDSRSPRVAIVNESFGRVLTGGGNPLNHRITEGHWKMGEAPATVEIIGVVPDIITNVAVVEPLVAYYPMAQQETPGTSRDLSLRATADPNAAIRETMGVITQAAPDAEVTPLLTLDARIAQQMSQQQLGMLVLGGLGVIAALLTLVGAYVLAESMASLRKREMGIRAALGANRRQLGLLILADTVRLVGLGIAVGVLLAWLGAGTIRTFLFRIQPLDPATLGSVAGAILALALVVSARPAVRASRADLAATLREE